MKTKTATLKDAALDWVVATCEGYTLTIHDACGAAVIAVRGLLTAAPQAHLTYAPSNNWAQGGPIIEREKLCIVPQFPSGWAATSDNAKDPIEIGPTPLIAAMRAYVASKLGEEVEVPDGLA